MDINEYLPMFLAEATEHLQELNLAVVRIEENPGDAETVNEIFRVAHSFKGMSATMGFEAIAALTHTMEDVFELLRQRRSGLPQDVVSVVLESVDALAAAVASIEADGTENLDPAPLIERLQGLIRSNDAEAEASAAAADTAGAASPAEAPATAAPPAVDAARAAGARVLHVHLRLAADAAMPGVRAFQAYAALGDHGDLVAVAPTEDELDSFGGGDIHAWVATEHEEDVVAETATAVADIAQATVTDVDAGAPVVAGEAPADAEPEAPAEVAEAGEPAPVVALAPASDAAAEPAARAPRKGAATVRVDAERLDGLMHLMGELVVHRTQVEALAAGAGVPELSQAVQDLARSSQALQAMVMQVRMVPVEAVFLRFPRLVRDLSVKLGRQVELTLVGQDTEVDRSVVDTIGDPLVHLVRNALDHGCEPPAEREAAGKPRTAKLEIAARHAGGRVLLEVRDDGAGIDPLKVATIAAKRGVIPEEAIPSIDMARATELLFAPGFSTAEKTSDVSGRGVGMDAVRDAVRELGGEVVLVSETGVGTTAQIRLPLTLAIVSALLVECGGQPFAVPLDRVEHTLRLDDTVVQTVAGRRVLSLRDGVLPLYEAGRSLGATPGEERFAVILRAEDRRVGLAVDRLLGQRELVTRPLPPSLDQRAAVSGAAVLSEGEIALIVDCDALEPSGAHLAAA